MTIEEELSDYKASNATFTTSDDRLLYDYKMKSNKILFKYQDSRNLSYNYKDIVKGEYDTEDDVVQERLDRLRRSLDVVWDEDIEAFELSRTYTDDGDLKELVFDIPTEEDYEPVNVLEIHDEDGNFVAHDVLHELEDDIQRLKSDSLYVDNLGFGDEQSIYVKENGEYFEAVKNYRSQRKRAHEYSGLKNEPKSNRALLKTWCLYFWAIIPFSILGFGLALILCEKERIRRIFLGFLADSCPIICIIVLFLYDLISPLHRGTTRKENLYTKNPNVKKEFFTWDVVHSIPVDKLFNDSSYIMRCNGIRFKNKENIFDGDFFYYSDIAKGDYEVEDDFIQEKLDELRNSLETVWDEEIEAFELSRRYTNDGELKQLVFDIPDEDEYEPVTVLEIHDEDGNFVANDVLDELGDELLKLDTDSLYVDNLCFDGRHSIYRKVKKRND